MFLISMELESSKKILNKISKDKKDFVIFTEGNIDEYLKDKKNKYVIIDQNDKNVDTYLNNKKKVIICNFSDKKSNKMYASNSNVFICNSERELFNVINEIMIEKQNKMHIQNIVVSVAGCLLIFILIALVSTNIFKNTNNIAPIKEKTTTNTKENIYAKENFLFLGDSITDFYDLERFYGDMPVVNSGISGDKYPQLLDHLEERVFKYNPTTVFILIGTNDICYSDVTDEELVEKIMEICEKIHDKKPKTRLYVESIYPVNNDTSDNDKVIDWMVSNRKNSRIKHINKLLEEKIKETDYVNYINFYDELVDEDGDLNIDYTVDGLHMSDEGYVVITKKIKSIIANDMKNA